MAMRVKNTRAPHGYYRYTAGCRCKVCREAKAAYIREKRAAARARGEVGASRGAHFVPGIKHGIYGYQEQMCRCEVCVETARAVKRRQWAAKRNRAAPLTPLAAPCRASASRSGTGRPPELKKEAPPQAARP